MLKKMLFVMNPTAGQRKAAKHLAEILNTFNRADYEVTAYMTNHAGHATQLVRQRAADHDLVVCAGGDGTLNEVINGLLSCGVHRPIGFIPAGSTNDFAASLGLSTNPLQAARDIVEGEATALDVGLFGQRHFSYVASFGAFTRVSYTTPQNIKNALGHLAYLLEGIQELSQIRPIHIRMELGEEVIEDDYIFGAVSNSTSIGGLLTLDSSQVDMSDGLLEVLLVRIPRDITELRALIQALQTQQYDCGVITFRSVPELTVEPEPDMVWTLDGERQEGAARIPIRNLHHAISILRKKESPE